jgi:hypothetical protein
MLKLLNEIKCNNCYKYGHYYNNCKCPIKSYGIIPYIYNVSINNIEFLMIQRRNTIGYVDIIRGKYNSYMILKNYIEELTIYEKYKLINYTFDELWDDIWLKYNSSVYIKDKKICKHLFYKTNVKNIVEQDLIYTKWEEQEYGFPKGRKDSETESDLQCAIREFGEETGYVEGDYTILKDQQLVEFFLSSDNRYYKHIYYIAKINYPLKKKFTLSQKIEIAKPAEFYTYKKCMNLIRNYNTAKRSILTKAYEIIYNIEKKNKWRLRLDF